MPLVSINILTQNRSADLIRALASVQRQSFRDFEVIVINDASSDNTAEVLQNCKLPNLRAINLTAPAGKTVNRQRALLASTGEFIAVLDDDDEWIDPNKLQKQVNFLQANPKAALLGTAALGVVKNEDPGKYLGRAQNDSSMRRTMLFKNNFWTSSIMFPRKTALAAGGFTVGGKDEAEDYSIWMRMGLLGTMHNLPEATVKYRLPNYNRPRLISIFIEQLRLVRQYGSGYPYYNLAVIVLQLRIVKLKCF